jgi:hypothetical protein
MAVKLINKYRLLLLITTPPFGLSVLIIVIILAAKPFNSSSGFPAMWITPVNPNFHSRTILHYHEILSDRLDLMVTTQTDVRRNIIIFTSLGRFPYGLPIIGRIPLH